MDDFVYGGFPTWWIRGGGLKSLSAKTVGGSIAALKIYLAIALSTHSVMADVRITIAQLQTITGLSKPMVTTGIKVLEKAGVLQVDRGWRSVYRLVQQDGQRHYAKLPQAVVRANLKNLPNSGVVGLAALKAYMTFLTVRQRSSHLASISHVGIQGFTAIRPALIARGVSVLYEHGLARRDDRVLHMGPDGRPANTYYLVGAFREFDTKEDMLVGTVSSEELAVLLQSATSYDGHMK